MFTGIIKETAPIVKSVRKGDSLELTIKKPKGWKLSLGESIALNGACMTVKSLAENDFSVFLMPESLRKTIFGISSPKKVNLEMPMKASDSFGGHMVLGHVDAVGEIAQIKKSGADKIYKISFKKEFANLVVPKGSIAVDGISLTVVEAGKNFLTVALIPYTLEHTTIGTKKVGDKVNLEFDIIAKHIIKYIGKRA